MRKLRFTVILVLLITTISSAQAQATVISPYYIGVETVAVSLSIDSGKAFCVAQVSSSSNSYKPSLALVLKKSADGISWSQVASWSASGAMGLSANINEKFTVSKGYS